jgi:hypothetical protein
MIRCVAESPRKQDDTGGYVEHGRHTPIMESRLEALCASCQLRLNVIFARKKKKKE